MTKYDPLTSWVGRLICRLTHTVDRVEVAHKSEKLGGSPILKVHCKEGCAYLTEPPVDYNRWAHRIWQKPIMPDKVWPPPEHPNCRCEPIGSHLLSKGERVVSIDAVRSYATFANSGSIIDHRSVSFKCNECGQLFDDRLTIVCFHHGNTVCPSCNKVLKDKDKADDYEI